MISEPSTHTCRLRWSGDNLDYETFSRLHDVHFPGGGGLRVGGAHLIQDPGQTNPEELLAASVGCCMMLTILAVFSRSKVSVISYEDSPEALLELAERRFRVTKVTLRPRISIRGQVAPDKLTTLIEKAHANCVITLSVKSEVIVEPVFVTV